MHLCICMTPLSLWSHGSPRSMSPWESATRPLPGERQRRLGRVKRTFTTHWFSSHRIQVAPLPIYPLHCLMRIQATMATTAAVSIYHRRFSGWWKRSLCTCFRDRKREGLIENRSQETRARERTPCFSPCGPLYTDDDGQITSSLSGAYNKSYRSPALVLTPIAPYVLLDSPTASNRLFICTLDQARFPLNSHLRLLRHLPYSD